MGLITMSQLRRICSGVKEQIVQLCLSCEAEYSANPNDYWDVPGDKELTCVCGGEIILVTKNVSIRQKHLNNCRTRACVCEKDECKS